MFEKFARSWELTKASAAVLRSDKELLLFPVISSLAALLVAATFLVPIFGLRLFELFLEPAELHVRHGAVGPGDLIARVEAERADMRAEVCLPPRLATGSSPSRATCPTAQTSSAPARAPTTLASAC